MLIREITKLKKSFKLQRSFLCVILVSLMAQNLTSYNSLSRTLQFFRGIQSDVNRRL